MSTPGEPPAGWGETPQGPLGYGQPQYGQPQYGPPGALPPAGYGQPGPGGPGWGPGPLPTTDRPGIVPLRPLALGEILDGAFGAVRANPRVMLGVPAAVLVACTLVSVVLGLLVVGLTSALSAGIDADLSEVGLGPGGYASLTSIGLQAVIVQLVAVPVLNGLLAGAVGDAVLGRRPSVTETWHRTRGRLLRLVGYTLLLFLAASVLVVGIVAGTVALIVTQVDAGTSVWASVGTGLAALLVLVVLVLWLQVRLLFTPAALVLEKQGVWRSVTRAWRLTRKGFWHVLGIWLLATIMVAIISGVVAYPFTLVGGLLVTVSPVAYTALSLLGSIVSGMLTTVFMSSIVALLYIDARMRREGLDIELAGTARREHGQA
ncbi:glycerophosphoryl diester phosphodiesterase membrane domain-containing protein [Cellulomonas sp. PhB143]|uniref:glycerophosphoryl diester phosphodiesterase membrane domain-containing protein n=1 Tax=Cellulomonas sp. PhB143 TaxID=2485186 RepID=UPI000F468521|nr:glycerophosphoryl diester phosphodiesterase membrane domain-containing protein [Cellulomonas sp. PhB143]ROS78519.1 glycerophosphoryl diester phosphodiesterase family protein [Cellulomonas sp. PhB143]